MQIDGTQRAALGISCMLNVSVGCGRTGKINFLPHLIIAGMCVSVYDEGAKDPILHMNTKATNGCAKLKLTY